MSLLGTGPRIPALATHTFEEVAEKTISVVKDRRDKEEVARERNWSLK